MLYVATIQKLRQRYVPITHADSSESITFSLNLQKFAQFMRSAENLASFAINFDFPIFINDASFKMLFTSNAWTTYL